ncbi:MAG: RHS repeat-associated core domain-containing protein [Planctomycetaceae bacterium]
MFAQDWLLDETGNWAGFKQDDNGNGTWDLNQSRTSNDVNEITDITETAGSSWVTPAYSAAGNMTTMPQPATPTSSYTATYDAWNRLVKIVDGSNTVAEYQYDGAKRRIVQKEYISGTLDQTRHLYYTEPSKWQVVEERIDSSADPNRQFVWGQRYIDDLILRDRDTTGNGTLDERLYALQDANWNVTSLIDTSGTVQQRFNYDAYGMPEFLTSGFAASANTKDFEVLYAGYRFENATTLFHVRNRVLNVALGCWVQRDPIGLAFAYNLYAYVDLAPLNQIDPSGLKPFRDCFSDYDTCVQQADIDFVDCDRKCCKFKGARRVRCTVLCQIWHNIDMDVCWFGFVACISTSDEVAMALAAGLVTLAVILALLEPTPAGEAALAGLLAGAAL